MLMSVGAVEKFVCFRSLRAMICVRFEVEGTAD